MEFEINHTWDGLPVNHDPVTIVYKSADEGLVMEVTAPFFSDPPPPPGKPGKPFPGLWDYEGYSLNSEKTLLMTWNNQDTCAELQPVNNAVYLVFPHDLTTIAEKWSKNLQSSCTVADIQKYLTILVEAFFLCHESKQYLEVELCPYGQHLVLLLSGQRNVWKQELALTFDVTRKDSRWEGSALIPWSYFPHGVDRLNAYAIHGSGDYRTYEALYPIPQSKIEVGQQPDFHRLEYFEQFSFDAIMGEAWKQPMSTLWMTKLPDKCQ